MSITLSPMRLTGELSSQSIIVANASCFFREDSTMGLLTSVSIAVTTMMKRSWTGVHLAIASINDVAQLPVRVRLGLKGATDVCGGFLEAIKRKVNAVADRIWPRWLEES